MIRLAAFDLDNTLLSSEKMVTPKDEAAVCASIEKGCHVILCSGRGRDGMLKTAGQLGVLERHEFYISDNGAVVTKGTESEPVYINTITSDDLAWIYEQGRRFSDDLNIQIYDKDRVYVERFDASTAYYQRVIGTEVGVLERLEEIPDIVKVVWNGKSSDRLDELRCELEPILPEGISMFKSTARLLEFVAVGTSKGNAVRFVAEQYGIPMEEVLCMGDNENDESMILAAGVGAAPANALERVRSISDYVASVDNDHGAAAEVLRKFVLS